MGVTERLREHLLYIYYWARNVLIAVNIFVFLLMSTKLRNLKKLYLGVRLLRS